MIHASSRYRYRKVLPARLQVLEDRDLPASLIGLLDGNSLVRFNSATPATVGTPVPVTGLNTDEVLLGIDLRPATLELWGLGSTGQLYTIDLTTGAASKIGAPLTLAPGTLYGFDFNPAADRLRIIGDDGTNFRIVPDDGTAFLDTPIEAKFDLTGAAYDQNFAGTAKTTLYAIDHVGDQLVTVGGLNGDPSPNGGAVFIIGDLGIDITGVMGFDVAFDDNVGYAAVMEVNGVDPQLVTIDLATGAATSLGTIAVTGMITGLASVPTMNVPPAIKSAAAATYQANGPAVVLSPAGTVIDPDSPTLDGGELTITITAGGSADDRLELMSNGVVTVMGADVLVNDVIVGTFAGGVGDADPLVVSFNANSSPAAAQAVLRAVAFRSVVATPTTDQRTVTYRLTDGNGGTSNTATTKLTVLADTSNPTVVSFVRDTDSPTNAATVTYTITFSEEVVGVDVGDFAIELVDSPDLTGVMIDSVTGDGTTFTITVDTGTGDGTFRVNLVANGTIEDLAGNPLELDNGLLVGPTTVIDRTAPTVTVEQADDQADPTPFLPIRFIVTFSEDVTGFDETGLILGGTAMPLTAAVTGSGKTYVVTVSEVMSAGTVTLTVAAGAAADAAGNGNLESTGNDNSVELLGNQTPVLILPPDQTFDEDASLTLAGAEAISIEDDAGANAVEVNLAVMSGTLRLAGGFTGLTFLVGTGTGDMNMTFRGKLADINFALDGLVYTPALNFNGTDTISITVDDLGNTGFGGAKVKTGAVILTVTAVNDAPVLTVPGAQVTGEGVTLVFSAANGNAITIDDVDVGDGKLLVTLTATGGKLILGDTTDITITAGENNSSSVTFEGKLAAVNAAVAGLSFVPNVGFTGAASITVFVDDQGNTGQGGPRTAEALIGVTVAANNQAPVITVVGPQTVAEDGQLLFPLDPIVISDADAGDNLIEVSLSAAHGKITINILNLDGLTFLVGTGNGDASMTFRGKIADINAALDAMLYVPDPNYNGPDAIVIVANDRGFTGFGGPQITTAQIDITVTPVNDAPVITIPEGFVGVDPGSTLTFSEANGNAILISDVDFEDDDLMEVTLEVANGTVSLSQTTDLTLINGDGVDDTLVRFQGTLAAINAALNGLVFSPAADFSGTASITISADDLGNTGAGGPLTTTRVLEITVAELNNPPVITAPESVTTAEDTAFFFTNGNTISIADPDIADGNLRVTLTAENGTLTLGDITGLTFIAGDGSNDASMSFEGTLAVVNAALATLRFDPTADFFGTATILILADDLGNTGAGGSKTDSRSITIEVTPVNDAPVVNVPPAQTVAVNGALVFSAANGNAVTVEDVDAGEGLLQVVISVANGTLTLSQIGGLTFSVGDGTADSAMTFTGKLTAINAAFAGMTFNPNADYSGPASIVVTVDDQGNTGAGGAKTGTGTIDITVTPANQGPVITAPQAVTVAEDTKLLFTNGNAVSVADADLGDGDIEITLTATDGVVSVTLTEGLQLINGAFEPAGSALTFRGRLAAVNAALATLFFVPAANFTGAASLTITADDLGNTGSGGAKSDTRTVAITVTPVNDAPTIVLPQGLEVNEGAQLVFSTGNGNAIIIDDVDIGDGNIRITLTVDFGSLTLAKLDGLTFEVGNGIADLTMTFTGTLSAVNLALDGLIFAAPQNFSGIVTLTVTADDLGNAGAGGPRTTTQSTAITVNAINNPPVISGPEAAEVDEDTDLVFSDANENRITISDADLGTNPLRVTLSVTNGTLSLGGTTGLTFEVGDGTDDTVMTFTGTVEAVNQALDGLRYRPNPNFNGTAALTITADDQSGENGTATKVVTITLNAVNDAPVITVPGPQTIDQNTTLAFSPLNNNVISISDIDIGTGDMKVTLSVTNGTLRLGLRAGLTFQVGDGEADTTMTFTGRLTDVNAALLTLTFTPTNGFSGVSILTITADDQGNTGSGGAKTDTKTVRINVNDTTDNSPPVANNDTYTTKAGVQLVISAPGVLVNDTDPDNDPLTAVLITGPTAEQGTLTLNADGSFTFTPAAGFVGTATFTYRASDGKLQSNVATVSIEVTGDAATGAVRLTAVGAGAGGEPVVTVYNDDGSIRGTFFAFDRSFRGGVFVATGDLNGDGIDDILVGAGEGGGPHIKIFNGANLQEYFSIFAYNPGFRGGVRVAIGDVNGDGRNDIITAAGPGGGPHVQMFDGFTGALISGYYAYDKAFAGGVFVAAIDVNGDGRSDVITGAGKGGGPHVRIFSGLSSAVIRDILAFDEGFLGGVTVAAGFNNANRPIIYTGAGAGGVPVVRGFDAANGLPVLAFLAYDSGFTGGVRVATERAAVGSRIVTGPGVGGGPDVRYFDDATLARIRGVSAFDPGFLGGVWVG